MIERFFAVLMTGPEWQLTLFQFGLLAFGGMIGFFTLKPRVPVRRVVYLTWIAAIALGATLSQLGWAWMGAAAASSLFAPFAALMFSAYILSGVLTYYASAGRALDIWGNCNLALLGFIPFANLVLLFKRGAHHEARKGLSWDPLIIVACLAVFFSGRAMDTAMTDFIADRVAADEQGTAALYQILSRAQTPDEAFAAEILTLRPQLPLPMDDGTTLIRAASSGSKMSFVFEVPYGYHNRAEAMAQALIQTYCAPDYFGETLAKGGQIDLRYLTPEKSELTTAFITAEVCAGT